MPKPWQGEHFVLPENRCEEFSSSVEFCWKTCPAGKFGQPQPSRVFWISREIAILSLQYPILSDTLPGRLGLPQMVRYPPLALSFREAHLCDTPSCNISHDNCAIPHKNKQEKLCNTIATIIAQCEKLGIPHGAFLGSNLLAPPFCSTKFPKKKKKSRDIGNEVSKIFSEICSKTCPEILPEISRAFLASGEVLPQYLTWFFPSEISNCKSNSKSNFTKSSQAHFCRLGSPKKWPRFSSIFTQRWLRISGLSIYRPW